MRNGIGGGSGGVAPRTFGDSGTVTKPRVSGAADTNRATCLDISYPVFSDQINFSRSLDTGRVLVFGFELHRDKIRKYY